MHTQLVNTGELTNRDRAAMYALLSQHFDGVTPAGFENDLQLKNWLILLKDGRKTLKGFSTLLLYDTTFKGEALSIVYSGDTIVDPSAWSSSGLPRAWVAAVQQLRALYCGNRLYWLLISSGFRTYRFLPTFWQTFYPRYDQPTPTQLKQLMHFLCRRQFGKCYDELTGVVRFPQAQRLKAHLSGIPPERLRNPHIQFFAQQNPGYRQGDELVCLTEIGAENLTPAGRRVWVGA